LVGERTRREGAERRDRTMQAQIAKEVEVQQVLKRERDDAFDQSAALKTAVDELTQARADAKAKQAEAQQAFTRDRNKALDEVAALKTTVEELTQARADADVRVLDLSQRLRNVRKSKAQEIARSIGASLPPFVIAAAVATLGFWSYQLIRSVPPPLLAVTSESTPEAEQQRLAAIKEAEQLQGKAADAEAKLQAAEEEQQGLKKEVQRQSTLAADAEAKRKAAEEEQQGLKKEVQRQSTLAADAEAKRKAAEERLAAFLSGQGGAGAEPVTKKSDIKTPLPAPPPTGLFIKRPNTEAWGYPADVSPADVSVSVVSTAACEQACMLVPTCKIFTYRKSDGMCYRYAKADFKSNANFDSGVRIEQTNPSANIKDAPPTSPTAPQVSPTGLFTIRTDTEAMGGQSKGSNATSRAACEEICTREASCRIFTYHKGNGGCYRYAGADFRSNASYDSGVRK
jgi:PAN domain